MKCRLKRRTFNGQLLTSLPTALVHSTFLPSIVCVRSPNTRSREDSSWNIIKQKPRGLPVRLLKQSVDLSGFASFGTNNQVGAPLKAQRPMSFEYAQGQLKKNSHQHHSTKKDKYGLFRLQKCQTTGRLEAVVSYLLAQGHKGLTAHRCSLNFSFLLRMCYFWAE